MKCACGSEATSFCGCKKTPIYICDSCILVHIKDKKSTHNIESIAPVETAKDKIISRLDKGKLEIMQHRQKIYSELSTLINLLLRTAKQGITALDAEETKIDNILIPMVTSPSSISNPTILKLLDEDAEAAEEQCEQWNFLDFSLDSEAIEFNIESWITVDSAIDKCLPPQAPEEEIDKEEIDEELEERLSEYLKYSRNSTTIALLPGESPTKLYSRTMSLRPSARSQPAYSALQNSLETAIAQTSPLFCGSGHQLRWSSRILFKNFKATRCFLVRCGLCMLEFSAAGWCCDTCIYVVCEKCGGKSNCTAPRLKCEQNHQLSICYDVASYYRSTNTKKALMCAFCTDPLGFPSWHCRVCKFDICIKCGERLGAAFVVTEIECAKQHPLQQFVIQSTVPEAQRPICAICKTRIIGVLHDCRPCQYRICNSCQEFNSKPLPPHPAICCQEYHLLRWIEIGGYSCNICHKDYTSERFRCKVCIFDMCLTCSKILEEIFNSGAFGKGSCKHSMIYTLLNSNMCSAIGARCAVCNDRYTSSVGLFKCMTCNVFNCVKCYYAKINQTSSVWNFEKFKLGIGQHSLTFK